MTFFLFLVLLMDQTCTIADMRLPSTALTETQVRVKAKQLWGVDYVVRSEFHGDLKYSIKRIGYNYIEEDWQFGFIQVPILKRVERIIGKDLAGSYRRAWNDAMVIQCREGKPVIP